LTYDRTLVILHRKFGGASLFDRRTTRCHPPHFSTAVYTALTAADPAVEPILKKLEEARVKAMKEAAGRPRGEQPPK